MVAVFKITTTDLDKPVLKVNISIGLWLILVAYLGIGALNMVKFLKKISAASNLNNCLHIPYEKNYSHERFACGV